MASIAVSELVRGDRNNYAVKDGQSAGSIQDPGNDLGIGLRDRLVEGFLP